MATKALILVGGDTRGTRFRPLSLDIPKVLFPVAGKPLLSHALSAVAKVPSIKEVLLVGFYDDYIFRDFLIDAATEFPQFKIKYLREYTALGTAGGLYHFRDVILSGDPEKFFVIHADVCCSFPLNEVLKLSQDKKASTVIVGTRVSYEAAKHFGAIVADPETHKVLHYVQNPESRISNLINAGIYLFDSKIFDFIREVQKERLTRVNQESLTVSSEELNKLRLEQDILTRLPETGSFYVYETRDFWRQIKSAGSAIPANTLYLQQLFQTDPHAPGLVAASSTIEPPVYIDPTAHVDPTAKLGPNVSIGPRCRIGRGARIRDAIVLDDSEIKHDSIVMHSILGRGCKVGSWARVEGTALHPTELDVTVLKNGVRVQAITILATNVTVGDEVRVFNSIVLPHKEIKVDVGNEVIM